MSKQKWKPIKEWEGRYDISNDGKIRSWYYGKKRLSEPRVLKTKVDRYGYEVVSLHQGKRKKSYMVHRLVAQAFLPNPHTLPQINHKNGVKTDNTVKNLEWCTVAFNIQHAFQKKLIRKENCSEGQKKRYKSEEEREKSRKRACAMWENKATAQKILDAHRTDEYRQKMSEKRQTQFPPTAGRKRINNGVIEKVVHIEDLPEYLKNGWRLGRILTKRKRS